MKKNFLYTFLILLQFSCAKEFTELAPISDRSIQSAYKTAVDFEVAVNGTYDALQLSGTYGKYYLILNEMRSDNVYNGGGSGGIASTLEDIDLFKEIPTATELSTSWADSYKGIARCNIILDKIDQSTVTDALKKRYKGEALYIRSLLYYNLAVIFGNIPLQLTYSNIVDLSQVTASKVYDQIAKDLVIAEPLLPAKYTLASDVGRVTSGAVATLLGKVYLTNGDKPNAILAFNRVIASKQYSLVADYAKLWGVANENGPESIFEVQFKTGGQGEGSGYFEYFAAILGRSGGAGGGNASMPVTPDLLAAYTKGDLRYTKSIYRAIKPPAPDTTYVTKYITTQTTSFDGDNNWVVSRYADVLLMLAEAVGEGTEAYGYINQVRARAGLPAISASTSGTFTEKLLADRRVEFAFENQRWQDLLRLGAAQTVMAKFLSIPSTSVRLIYPIPQKEIDVSNGKIIQNTF